jgi:hypothetical protein
VGPVRLGDAVRIAAANISAEAFGTLPGALRMKCTRQPVSARPRNHAPMACLGSPAVGARSTRTVHSWTAPTGSSQIPSVAGSGALAEWPHDKPRAPTDSSNRSAQLDSTGTFVRNTHLRERVRCWAVERVGGRVGRGASRCVGRSGPKCAHV